MAKPESIGLPFLAVALAHAPINPQKLFVFLKYLTLFKYPVWINIDGIFHIESLLSIGNYYK
jgi:hypothetical protein